MTERHRLIIATRYPTPGVTKPRMIQTIGGEQTTIIQREIIEHIVMNAQAFCNHDRSARSVEIRFAGCDTDTIWSWLGNGIAYIPHIGGDVGDRICRALRDAFRDGAKFVVITGTDCPGLTEQLLEEAFAALHLNDVVIGPSSNGNYYLIGIGKQAQLTALPALFRGIAWGTGFVYGDTMSVLKRLGLSYTVLETLAEVNTFEDLSVWERIKAVNIRKHNHPVISVVIPTLNNATLIDSTIESIMTAENIEVIIADGGSNDDTVVRAITRGAHVVESLPGRTHQLNAGTSEATGQYLLFLNPGTILFPGFDRMIRDTLADFSTACGAFTLRIDSPRRISRTVERAIRFRSNMLHHPYSDQGLFLRTEQLVAIGGVPARKNSHLIRRLRKIGRIVVTPDIALTRAPRWIAPGPERLFLLHFLLIVARVTGFITRLYRSVFGSTDHMTVNG